jgi:CBS domain-containing protein
MAIGEVCVRDVVFADEDMMVREAAQLMRRHHVGNLVVVEEGAGGRRTPVGIVTDRDIVLSVVATALDPATFRLRDLGLKRLVTAREDESIF